VRAASTDLNGIGVRPFAIRSRERASVRPASVLAFCPIRRARIDRGSMFQKGRFQVNPWFPIRSTIAIGGRMCRR